MAIGFALTLVPACGSKDSGDEKASREDDDDAPKKKKKKKKGSEEPEDEAKEGATAKPSGDAKPTGGDTKPPVAETPAPPPTVPPPLPAGRSPVPTIDEWNAVTKEVGVKGSSALNCETKMVREYLRISCRGKNDTGGTPLSVVRKKGAQDAYLFTAAGVMSVVVAYVEGIDATFTFAWTDKTHPLHLSWPRGSKMPQILGVFEGAKSPLDASSAVDPGLCKRCDQQLGATPFGDALCEVLLSNPACVRTYSNDCQKLRECSLGEPSAMVSCPAGTIIVGTGHSCAEVCGSGRSCPSGKSCMDGVASQPVCIEN